MDRFSATSLFFKGIAGNRSWSRHWRRASPKNGYDVVIVGGGGHGLATAFYLARNHGARVAVVERRHVGNGNIARNTTIVRSNYLQYANNRFAEHSLRLWEGLERELNFNLMVSQRGVINLAHSDGQLEAFARRGNAMRVAGIDGRLLDLRELKEMLPAIDFSTPRYPIVGGLFQQRGGTVRHDAVAWGFARAASALGVDIIENCEVTGVTIDSGRVKGVTTSKGAVEAARVLLSGSGQSSRLAALAGLRLPVETHLLQAFVTEGLKPVLDHVVTFGAGDFYMSQSDKGGLVFGGGFDGYPSYSSYGGFSNLQKVAVEAVALFPFLSRVRILRGWSGTVDVSMDGAAIMGETGIEGLYVNAGWGGSGFKATPGVGFCLATHLATGRCHALAMPFRLSRFAEGSLQVEGETGGRSNLL